MGSIASKITTKWAKGIAKVGVEELGKAFPISGGAVLKGLGPRSQAFYEAVKTGTEAGEQLWSLPVHDVYNAVKGIPDGVIAKELKSGNITLPASTIVKMKQEDAYFAAKDLGIAKEFTPNYWAKMFPDGHFDDIGNMNKAIKHLVDTGKARNAIHAESIINYHRGGGKMAYNIEKRRLADLPGEREDNMVPIDYLKQVWNRVAQVKQFGKNDEILEDMLLQVRQEEGPVAETYARFMGEHKLGRSIGSGPSSYAGKKYSPLEHNISSVEALTKLGLATISQAGQFVNVPIFLRGIAPTIRGAARMVADFGDAERFTVEAGSTAYQTYRQAREVLLKETTLGGQALKYTRFTWMDRMLRIFASNAGRESAEANFATLLKNPDNVGARSMLQTLGVDFREALKKGSLSPDDLLTAARRTSDITQFTSSIENLPPAWKTDPRIRVATMFKTYGFQQTKFMKDYVFLPATRGDVKPLMMAAILFPTVGEIIKDTSELARRGTLKERPDWSRHPYDRLLENAMAVGVLGITYDTMRSLSYNDQTPFWRFLGGPVLGDVVDVAKMLTSFDSRRSHPLDRMTDQAKQKLTRSIPVVGPRLYEEWFGRYHKQPPFGFKAGVVTKFVEDLTKTKKKSVFDVE